jgi:hydroxymethylpyrimidine/phosphomethylpyrimidine kinase
MRKALTIAGSDSGGGAGIQADLKTFAALGVYGSSAITALTAQNTLGVQGVYPVDPEFVGQQIDSVMSDIGADAAKTGMLFSAEIIQVVALRVRRWGIEQLVVDPVMVAKSGDRLLREDAIDALTRELLPLAYIITPNLGEASVLAGLEVNGKPAMEQAARAIHALGARIVVVKGGHLADCADDLVYDGADRCAGYPPSILTRRTRTAQAAPSRRRLRHSWRRDTRRWKRLPARKITSRQRFGRRSPSARGTALCITSTPTTAKARFESRFCGGAGFEHRAPYSVQHPAPKLNSTISRSASSTMLSPFTSP